MAVPVVEQPKQVVIGSRGSEMLSLDAIQEYITRKGITVYFYKLRGNYLLDCPVDKVCGLSRIKAEWPNLWMTLEDFGAVTDISSFIGKHWDTWSDIPRDDPELIAVIDMLGVEKAAGRGTRLEVVKIPEGVEYEICEIEGVELVTIS
jgi:hypothetical protein